jgi:hypothetical protein
VSLMRSLEGLSHGSTRFKTHNRLASAAIAGGFVQTRFAPNRRAGISRSSTSPRCRLTGHAIAGQTGSDDYFGVTDHPPRTSSFASHNSVSAWAVRRRGIESPHRLFSS